MEMPLLAPGELRSLKVLLPLPIFNVRSSSYDITKAIEDAEKCSWEVQNALESVWTAVLGPDTLPTQRGFISFWDLGGDVVKACQMAALMERSGYQLHIEDIFHAPTWTSLLEILARRFRSEY
ncbi:hypothetical protein GGI43DRAFT_404399 [Trichoderma evansii]